MKKLGVLVLAAGMLLGMSGCVAEGGQQDVYEWVAVLNDGRKMDCINASGGVSCDWDSLR